MHGVTYARPPVVVGRRLTPSFRFRSLPITFPIAAGQPAGRITPTVQSAPGVYSSLDRTTQKQVHQYGQLGMVRMGAATSSIVRHV